MTEPVYEPEALGAYRRTLGEAADNEPVIMLEDPAAERWIEELEACRAEDASGERLREAFDFAVALQLLDARDAEVEYVGEASTHESVWRRAGRRVRIPWPRTRAQAQPQAPTRTFGQPATWPQQWSLE